MRSIASLIVYLLACVACSDGETISPGHSDPVAIPSSTTINILSPGDGFQTSEENIEISGTVNNPLSDLSLAINGQIIELNSPTAFSAEIGLSRPGVNQVDACVFSPSISKSPTCQSINVELTGFELKSAILNSEGGEVEDRDLSSTSFGAIVSVPQDALSSEQVFFFTERFEQSSSVPDEYDQVGPYTLIQPVSAVFDVPISITLPLDNLDVSPDANPVVVIADGDFGWQEIIPVNSSLSSVTIELTETPYSAYVPVQRN